MCKELDDFVVAVKEIYGDSLDRIILFGSRARGDYRDDSDYDVMILTSLPQLREFTEKKRMTRYASYNMNVEINPVFQNTTFFEKWNDASPYYKNITREGKVLYDRRTVYCAYLRGGSGVTSFERCSREYYRD